MRTCFYYHRCPQYDVESLRCNHFPDFCKTYKQNERQKDIREGTIEYWEQERVRLLRLAGRGRELR
jgi:hypothetical protein